MSDRQITPAERRELLAAWTAARRPVDLANAACVVLLLAFLVGFPVVLLVLGSSR